MGNDANPKQLSGSATTTLGSCYLYNLSINKVLAGTMTIKEGTSTVGTFAIGTGPGNFFTHTGGVRFANLSIVLSAGDDVTSLTRAV